MGDVGTEAVAGAEGSSGIRVGVVGGATSATTGGTLAGPRDVEFERGKSEAPDVERAGARAVSRADALSIVVGASALWLAANT
jgi:hypothetical protein